jgi:hypothetical protein
MEVGWCKCRSSCNNIHCRRSLGLQAIRLLLPIRRPQSPALSPLLSTVPTPLDLQWNFCRNVSHIYQLIDEGEKRWAKCTETKDKMYGSGQTGVSLFACGVPGTKYPYLVPDFAIRLANRFGLPFRVALRKIDDRPEQTNMANSTQGGTQHRWLTRCYQARTTR